MRLPLCLVLFLPLACSSTTAGDDGLEAAPIIGGQLARDYPEAVLVDNDRGRCSGAMIAPRVVLTAGHCVKGSSRWTVTAPFAGDQRAVSQTAWTEYTAMSGLINPRAIDVALVILDTPITLDAYPPVAESPVRDSTKGTSVGRVKNGAVSTSALFVGQPVALGRGQIHGYPYAYVGDQVVESGDSGGPTYTKTSAGRQIVAVASGAASGRQVLGRVDLVKSTIDRIIAESAVVPTE